MLSRKLSSLIFESLILPENSYRAVSCIADASEFAFFLCGMDFLSKQDGLNGNGKLSFFEKL